MLWLISYKVPIFHEKFASSYCDRMSITIPQRWYEYSLDISRSKASRET